MNVSWTSDTPSVATVGISSGVVTPVSSGTATVTVTTADGGKTATCLVTVYVAVTAVDLKTAGNFAILAKSAISTVPTSAVTGDIGLSPAAESFITGFVLSNVETPIQYATDVSQVTGNIYAADMTGGTTAANMTTAISDMAAAYTDAATRPTPSFTGLHAGNIGGLVLVPGIYKWTTAVSIPTSVTLQGNGSSNGVWIFQISGDLTEASAMTISMSNGALAKNVFWQVAGAVSLGANSHFEGNILCQTSITLITGASINGRVLAQTGVALQQAVVTEPSP
jgi:hypothetical protein